MSRALLLLLPPPPPACRMRAVLVRGGAVWQLVGLITRRSQVQILPPLPNVARRSQNTGFCQVWPSDELFLVPGIRERKYRKKGRKALFCFHDLEKDGKYQDDG